MEEARKHKNQLEDDVISGFINNPTTISNPTCQMLQVVLDCEAQGDPLEDLMEQQISTTTVHNSKSVEIAPRKSLNINANLEEQQQQNLIQTLSKYQQAFSWEYSDMKVIDPNFSKIATPLHALTGNVEFQWSEKCDVAFARLKKLISTVPVLRGPNWKIPFQISIDTSDIAIGDVLGQEEEKKPYAIYFIIKNLTPAELNYIVTEKEFIIVIHAINKFRHYITGYPVILYIDHSAIRYLANKPITNGWVT
jgi:hypothetical protein